eukprot:COSAG01_NODE_2730_length_7172_cov_35.156087_2_plen_219_part_00
MCGKVTGCRTGPPTPRWMQGVSRSLGGSLGCTRWPVRAWPCSVARSDPCIGLICPLACGTTDLTTSTPSSPARPRLLQAPLSRSTPVCATTSRKTALGPPTCALLCQRTPATPCRPTGRRTAKLGPFHRLCQPDCQQHRKRSEHRVADTEWRVAYYFLRLPDFWLHGLQELVSDRPAKVFSAGRGAPQLLSMVTVAILLAYPSICPTKFGNRVCAART